MQKLLQSLLDLLGPSHGTVAMNADGSFIYVPAAGYQGTDSFTYVDTQGKSKSTWPPSRSM